MSQRVTIVSLVFFRASRLIFSPAHHILSPPAPEHMIECNPLAFLREFSLLTPRQQQIYLWCLEHRPYPRSHTGDFADIAIATGSCRNTVRFALLAIARTKYLSTTVRVVRIKNHVEEFYASIAEQTQAAACPSDIE